MRLRKLFALLFAVTLLFAACSDDEGDDESSDDTTESSDESEAEDEEAEDEEAEDEEAEDEEGSDGGSGACDEITEAFTELGTGSANDPEAISEAFEQFAEEGPEELADDAQIIADAMADYDPDDLSASAETFSDPEFTEALTNFSTGLATACIEDANEQLDDLEEELDEEIGDITIPSIPE